MNNPKARLEDTRNAGSSKAVLIKTMISKVVKLSVHSTSHVLAHADKEPLHWLNTDQSKSLLGTLRGKFTHFDTSAETSVETDIYKHIYPT